MLVLQCMERQNNLSQLKSIVHDLKPKFSDSQIDRSIGELKELGYIGDSCGLSVPVESKAKR